MKTIIKKSLLPILIIFTNIKLIHSDSTGGGDKTNIINLNAQNEKLNHTNEIMTKRSIGFIDPFAGYAIDPPQLSLSERIEIEKTTWHWFPYKRINYHITETGEFVEEECDESHAIDDFPEDLFTQRQREQGAIILHFLGAIYAFTILGYVVGSYFIPSVECICDDLKLSPDVAAATFMATATTLPEFFTNTISTFISDSDMGLGTVIGSMLFNTLGVAACASLAAAKAVQLDWWPVTRDCCIFSFHVTILIIFSWDGRIQWWEAMVFLLLYFNYFIVMFQNKRIRYLVKKIEDRFGCCIGRPYDFSSTDMERPTNNNSAANDDPKGITNNAFTVDAATGDVGKIEAGKENVKQLDDDPVGNEIKLRHIWELPKGETKIRKFWFFYSWPMKIILMYTVPDPNTHRKFYPLTFIMCIIWIGGTSLFIFWMVAMVGYTFNIPESVMGMTFLAAGGCLPEAVSAVIMIRKGDGGMGVSNSLGANSLAVLFSLGVPWFIRTMVDGGPTDSDSYVDIHSYGMEWIVLSLLFAVILLYIILAIGKFQLKRFVGLALILIYTLFVTFAILVEVDVLFDSGDDC